MCLSPSRGLGAWGFFLVLGASLGIAGCGASTATLSGKVSYKDKLLKGGNITFVSLEGKPSVSTSINEDGTYTCAKVPTGKVKICVETQSLNPKNKSKVPMNYSPPAGQEPPSGFGPGNSADLGKRYVWIPDHFAAPEQSTLTAEVKDSETHDIKLD